jgi:histidinol phosphatase-like PHP family hydrolase
VLSELLARESEASDGPLQRAYRRAARAALTWPEEAVRLREEGRPLTELRAVGPFLARRIAGWLDAPPDVPEPPPLRRGFVTMAQARRRLARRPEVRAALRCDLQVHTTWSDGAESVATMAAAARALGHSHVAITDHSQGLAIAGGMDPAELRAQRREIAALNRASRDGFRILPAIEMNLSPQGEGDMPRASLRPLALVLGAFHSALRRVEDQTDRYVAALRRGGIDVLAHPRCRVWERRLGLTADWRRVFDVAAEEGVAVEIDGTIDRQDLDEPLVREAVAAGAFLSLGSDAHYVHELEYVDVALAIALAAEAPIDRILNFRSAEELASWTRARRARG